MIIDNIYDDAFAIVLPQPEKAAGLFYSIVVMPNPSGVGAELDITIKDANGTEIVVIDAWAEHALIWSDGFYFHNLS